MIRTSFSLFTLLLSAALSPLSALAGPLPDGSQAPPTERTLTLERGWGRLGLDDLKDIDFGDIDLGEIGSIGDIGSIGGIDLDDLNPPEKDINRRLTGVNAFANDPRFGTVRAQLAEPVRTLGVKYLRVLFAWNDQVQPAPGAPINFSFYDEIARRIPRGAEALVVLTGLPTWMKDPKNWVGTDPRRTFVEQWVKPVVRRYRKNARLNAYQIWNEPNMLSNPDNGTLGVADSPQNYVALLTQAHRAVKRLNKRKKVVTAATTAINQNYPETLDYNKKLRDAGVEKAADVYAVHYYGTHTENVLRPDGVKDFLPTLRRAIWVTESGRQGILRQKEYVRRAWPLLEEKFPQIKRYYYYQFTDGDPAERSYGLKVVNPEPRVSDLYLYLRETKPR